MMMMMLMMMMMMMMTRRTRTKPQHVITIRLAVNLARNAKKKTMKPMKKEKNGQEISRPRAMPVLLP